MSSFLLAFRCLIFPQEVGSGSIHGSVPPGGGRSDCGLLCLGKRKCLSVNGSDEFLVGSGSTDYLQVAGCRGWWSDCLRRWCLYGEELRMNTDLDVFQRMWCVNEAVCSFR